MTSRAPTDDTATRTELGLTYRPLAETCRDTIGWLRDIGQLPQAT